MAKKSWHILITPGLRLGINFQTKRLVEANLSFGFRSGGVLILVPNLLVPTSLGWVIYLVYISTYITVPVYIFILSILKLILVNFH